MLGEPRLRHGKAGLLATMEVCEQAQRATAATSTSEIMPEAVRMKDERIIAAEAPIAAGFLAPRAMHLGRELARPSVETGMLCGRYPGGR